MALVVESTSSNSTTSSTSLTITKPTGLAVGDLMVASLSAYASSGDYTTLSGWTLLLNQRCTEGTSSVQYKVATSGDVAASDFTFVSPSSSLNGGTIMRVSGFNTLAPFEYSDSDAANPTSATISFSTSTTPSDGSLILLNLQGNNGAADGTFTMSGYNVTGLSLTWTELYDYSANLSADNDIVIAGAYALVTTGAAITAYGATISGSRVQHSGILGVITARTDASGSNTLIATTSQAFTQSGTCDGNASNTLVTTTSAAFTQSGTGTSPTTWSNPNKSSASWSNENK